MKKIYEKNKKFWISIGLILLVAAIAWAAAELSGQANAAAADAGDQSFELETISMDMIKEPKPKNEPPPCDWQLEKDLRKKIEVNNDLYKKLLEKAKSEAKSAGKVSGETGEALLNSATEYKGLQEEYASMWDSCTCKTRAKLARELAETRLKGAEVVASEIDKEKLEALEKQQEQMKKARREYVENATKNEEISAEDKKDIQANLVPRSNMLVSNIGESVQKVMGLLQQVQETATKVKSGGLMSGLKAMKGLSEGNLLQPVQGLLSLVKNMLTNAQDLSSDVQLLSGN